MKLMTFKMTRAQRIIALLVIDTAFFFLEIGVGYAVKSLALVADSFHMLNDVMSLVVALYALKLAERSSTEKYSYGWQRAEVLGALFNGVFLLALCLSIFMQAIERFFTPAEVGRPQLVVIVGSLGLFFNIIGLVLFHEHGHSHGGGGHGHSHGADEAHEPHKHSTPDATDLEANGAANGDTHAHDISSPAVGAGAGKRERVRSMDSARRSYSGLSEIHVLPSENRAAVVASAAALSSSIDESHMNRSHHGHGHAHEHSHSHSIHSQHKGKINGDHSPSFAASDLVESGGNDRGHEHNHDHGHDHGADQPNERSPLFTHDNHKHNNSASESHGGHSHGNMNMRGVFLHVMGDALTNVSVIITGLIIWLSTWPGRFYFDPAISLLISIVIFASAMPLVKSASIILLQAVPAGIQLDDVREDIESIPGVLSVHELHIWQLSDVKLIASIHVVIDRDRSQVTYMHLASEIRSCLHAYGVHSATIQPEFVTAVKNSELEQRAASLAAAGHLSGSDSRTDGLSSHAKSGASSHVAQGGTKALGPIVENDGTIVLDQDGKEIEENRCLINCVGPDCNEQSCCPPPAPSVNTSTASAD